MDYNEDNIKEVISSPFTYRSLDKETDELLIKYQLDMKEKANVQEMDEKNPTFIEVGSNPCTEDGLGRALSEIFAKLESQIETQNKMIIAMAIKKYNFNRTGIEDSLVEEIQNDISECGFSVSKEEILTHLLAADKIELDHPPKI